MDCSIVVVSKGLVNKKVFYLCLFPLKCLEIIEKSELVVYSSPVSVDCFKSVSYHPSHYDLFILSGIPHSNACPIYLDDFCNSS